MEPQNGIIRDSRTGSASAGASEAPDRCVWKNKLKGPDTRRRNVHSSEDVFPLEKREVFFFSWWQGERWGRSCQATGIVPKGSESLRLKVGLGKSRVIPWGSWGYTEQSMTHFHLINTLFKKKFFFFIYLFMETHRERGWDTGRGRSRLPAGSLMRDSVPAPQDHDLSPRQMLNSWATQAYLLFFFLIEV